MHYFHEVGGGTALVTGRPLLSEGSIRLDITERESVEGRKGLYAKVILENVEPFSVMALALKNENPALRYRAWLPNPSYPRTTLCVETVRDGVRQVFLAVVGSGKPPVGTTEVGEVEFDVRSSDPLQLGPDDLRSPRHISSARSRYGISSSLRRTTRTRLIRPPR
jgi:hypothetical protein